MFPFNNFYQNFHQNPYQFPLNYFAGNLDYNNGVQDQTAMTAAILASQYQYQLQLQQFQQLQMQQEPHQYPFLSNPIVPHFMLQPPSHYQIPSPSQLEGQQPLLLKRDQDELVCNRSSVDVNNGGGLIARPPAKRYRPKKYQCPECWVSLSNIGQFNGHIRIHTGERPFVCDNESCGKSFTRNEELTRHKRIHTGLRPYSCIKCEKCFGRKDHLKKHLRTHDKHDNSLNVTGQSIIACYDTEEENDTGCVAGVLDVQY